MEKVWKDISTLSPLPDTPLNHNHNHRNDHHQYNHNSHSFRSMILQDFLSHPSSSSSSYSSSSSSAATSPPSPLTSTSTALSLNSANNYHYFSNIINNSPITNTTTTTTTITMDIISISINHCNSKGAAAAAAAASSSSYNSNGTNNLNRFSDQCDTTTPDRRHKRMIKNRESAARSRARKQAYINELELEVAHLMEENATLREQHHHRQEQHQPLFQVQPATTVADAHHRPRLIQNHAHRRLPILRRTSTAPF